VQAAVTCAIAYGPLGVDSRGSTWLVGLIAVANGLLGMALGLCTSAFARTEFQATQFMPAVVVPQLLLGGLVWPREQMAGVLEAISRALPMTYAIDALRDVGSNESPSATTWWNLTAVVLAAVVALMLGAATLRRRTP
jgi:ABC-2 type transport system permease protein